MDDFEKHASSYQQDQEILDARGINMTVEEVAGLPTVKYSEKVQGLRLNEDDLAFLKGLRRRIKNRLASQNSRRRSVEHLRRLTRELRVVRAKRSDAVSERRALLKKRDDVRERCRLLRGHIVKILQERSDPTQVPDITTESHSNSITDEFDDKFECRIEKLVQKSVNHIFEKKKVSAKTVFLEDDINSNKKVKTEPCEIMNVSCSADDFNDYSVRNGDVMPVFDDCKGVLKEDNCDVLDLCVKEKRRSHGRKQSAPRRIAYVTDYNDMVLDLKIKKENQ